VLTLRNFGLLLLFGILVFAGLTIASNRGKSTPGEYGRLYGKQQPPVGKAQFHPAIVTEAPPPVPEQERADPMLLESAARSQYLGTDPNSPPATASAGTSIVDPAAATTSSATSVDNASFGSSPANAPLRRGQKVSIVGDSNGVTVVKH
jgi:hypothetical protein